MSLLDALQKRLERVAPATAAAPPAPVVREVDRIKALPRRQRPTPEELRALAVDFKARLGVGSTLCECKSKYRRACCQDLLPVQAWTLDEAEQVGGILGPIGVGHGKTLLDLLTPMVVKCRTAVLLLPPNLKKQLLEVDWHFYGQHWKLPNLVGAKFHYPGRPLLHVVAYTELSGAKNSDILDRLAPDIIVMDEAHNVSSLTSARTKRLHRFLRQHPSVKVFCWSGTLTKRSLRDWAHLAASALKQGAPVPLDWPTLEAWAGATDPSDFPSPAGDLVKLCGPGELPSEALARRVKETHGVVSSGDASSCEASLTITERPVKAPALVEEKVKDVVTKWQRPDGEELVDAMTVARVAREVSSGFWYKWKWIRGESKEVRDTWLEARKEWHKELRERLKTAGPWLDSPLNLTKAAIRWHDGYVYIDEAGNRHVVPPHTRTPVAKHPVWAAETWQRWREVRDTAEPVTEANWLDKFLVQDTLEWLRKGPGLAWYEHDAFGVALMAEARAQGVPVVFCGPGDEGADRVIRLKGDERALLTIRSHGEGKNLQMFNRNLVANPPSGGAVWEQLLGRTHRQGQLLDEVTVEVYRHTGPFRDAIETARELSAYIQGSGVGNVQKLVAKATWGF